MFRMVIALSEYRCSHPVPRLNFYTIYPIIQRLAWGADVLTQEDDWS